MRAALACSILVQLLPLRAGAQPLPSKSLECRQDADCGFAISVCGRCDPCAETWRPATTQGEIRRVREIQARARCARKACEACSSPMRWVGDRVVCRARRCSAANIAASLPERGKELACKVDSDCVIKPIPRCGCPPCGLQVPEVVSRQHAAWLQSEQAKVRCPAVRCGACGPPLRWLPGQPACHAGRCLLIPVR
jgi:hypothetical protein